VAVSGMPKGRSRSAAPAGCKGSSERRRQGHHVVVDETVMCVRPLSLRDASALIGVSRMLPAELIAGQHDQHLERHMRERLAGDGLLWVIRL
jgi:hypothetical protein